MTARVLVVDDLIPNVRLLEAKLNAEYYDVVTANDGPSAIDIVERDAPDIVLLDVMMPGMDGFEVCRRIKSNPRCAHIPIVMVTALSDSVNKVRGLEAGADDFLTKPVNDVALMARVRSLVRLKMMMDEWRMREETAGSFGVIDQQGGAEHDDVGGANILVVEDNEVNAAKIVKALEKDGNAVIAVRSGADMFERLRAQPVELLIISLTLREEDGLRLLSQARSHEDFRQIPILAVAEEDDTQRLAKGLDLGATDYAHKPLDAAELLARSRAQIRRKRYQDRLRGSYERSITMALTDSLTGLHNRRYLEAHLDGLVKRAEDSQKALSVLLFDIDHFKKINDTYGHRVGDEVLVELSNRVRRNVRGFDLTARYGGEEFIVVMPDTTMEVAYAVAERLRSKIAAVEFAPPSMDKGITVTVSIGAAMAVENETPGNLIERADRALYAAKHAGRNRVIRAPDPTPAG